MKRVIKLLVSTGFWIFNCACNRTRSLMGGTFQGSCVVLYYHAVTGTQRSRFARQMDDLRRWATPIAAHGDYCLERGVRYAAVTFDDGFQSTAANAIPELVTRGIPATIFVPTGYLGRYATWTQNDKHELVMTPGQLREIPSALVCVGSHTVTHPKLPLLSESEARTELIESKEQLESILGRKVTTISFPYGEYDDTSIRLSRMAGYERVFTTIPMLNYAGAYAIGRVSAGPSDWRLEFYLKVMGAYRWLPAAFSIKRRLRRFGLSGGWLRSKAEPKAQ